MARATAAGRDPGRATARQGCFRSPTEMREVLDRALRRVDSDEVAGPLLNATRMRLELQCPDMALTVAIAASEDPEHSLEWSFDPGGDWQPKLRLTMDSEIANRYLQGAESIAIAMARGKIRCSGASRAALLYVPAAKTITEKYRRVVEDRYPHLLVT